MNRKDICRWAEEADREWDCDRDMIEWLECFATLAYESAFRDANIAASRTILDAAVATEREACAKELEIISQKIPVEQREGFVYKTIIECVATIRKRSWDKK